MGSGGEDIGDQDSGSLTMKEEKKEKEGALWSGEVRRSIGGKSIEDKDKWYEMEGQEVKEKKEEKEKMEKGEEKEEKRE